MSSLAQMRTDTVWFLAQWGESALRRRKSATYDNAMRASESWSSSLSFNWAFEPLSGDEMQAEAGLQHKSDGKGFVEHDTDVTAGDRVIWDGNTYRCNYTQPLKGHKLAFVYKELNP